MRTFEDKGNHDALVRMMAKYFSSLGYTGIKADLEGYSSPDAIWWKNRPQEQKIPDLTCFKNDDKRTLLILEAETCPTLTTEHTAEQWKLFQANAKHNNGEFHVVVPRTCFFGNKPIEGNELAKKVADQLGITIDMIWRPSP